MEHLKYEPAFDGIRAVAVTIVIAAHLFPDTIRAGWFGVYIFFVLSGFLITRILMQELRATGSIRLGRFYLRRTMRLMPPLWTLLLVLLPFILLGHHRGEQFGSWAMAASYLMNFNRAFGWFSNYALGHTWSLAAEEQFYWLWPALLLLGAKRYPKAVIGALFLIVTIWRAWLFKHGASFERIYNGLDTDSDAILLGCFLGLVPVPGWLKRAIDVVGYGWLVLVAIATLAFSGDLGLPYILELTAGSILAACLIIAASGAAMERVLSAQSLVFTGKISYALYLWHFPLITLMDAKWHLKGEQNIIPVAMSYMIAAASYFTIEAYFRQIKRRASVPAFALEKLA